MTSTVDYAALIERLWKHKRLLLRVGDQELVGEAADALAALVGRVESLTNDVRSIKPAMQAEQRRHAKARQAFHTAANEAERLRAALTQFVAWFDQQDDGEDGIDYLNGDSDKYPGDGEEDLKAIAAASRAALEDRP